MERDDAIRKVVSLRALADHPATGPGEAENASAMAERLIARFKITDEDIEDYADVTDSELFGIRISADVTRRYNRLQRKKREVIDSILRLQSFMAEEDNRGWRDEKFYDEIEKQVEYAKSQLRKCGSCDKQGFGKLGVCQRYLNGRTAAGRQRYIWMHPKCHEEWLELVKKHIEANPGKVSNAKDFGL